MKTIKEIKTIIKEEGGFSLNKDLSCSPVDGYMVGDGKNEIVIKLNKITWDILNELRDSLNVEEYIGAWLYDGNVYLDISQNVKTLDDALKLAKVRNELAIWDVKEKKEVKVK